MCVHEEAAGGVNQRVLHVVDTLVPARRQRRGSRGDLEEMETALFDLCHNLHFMICCKVPAEAPAEKKKVKIENHSRRRDSLITVMNI